MSTGERAAVPGLRVEAAVPALGVGRHILEALHASLRTPPKGQDPAGVQPEGPLPGLRPIAAALINCGRLPK